MLSSKLETPVEMIRPYFELFAEFQILAVPAGRAGQRFDLSALPKIEALRREKPDATIEVDGGIDLHVAKMVKDAGANVIVSSNYIFGNNEPGKAYEELKNI